MAPEFPVFHPLCCLLHTRAGICMVNQPVEWLKGWVGVGKVARFLIPGELGSLPVKWRPTGNEVNDTQGQSLPLLGPHGLSTASPRAPKPGEVGEATPLPLSQPELSELIPGRRHISPGESVPACSAESAEIQPLLCQLREPLHGHHQASLPPSQRSPHHRHASCACFLLTCPLELSPAQQS